MDFEEGRQSRYFQPEIVDLQCPMIPELVHSEQLGDRILLADFDGKVSDASTVDLTHSSSRECAARFIFPTFNSASTCNATAIHALGSAAASRDALYPDPCILLFIDLKMSLKYTWNIQVAQAPALQLLARFV